MELDPLWKDTRLKALLCKGIGTFYSAGAKERDLAMAFDEPPCPKVVQPQKTVGTQIPVESQTGVD